jgi:hypothetical protein
MSRGQGFPQSAGLTDFLTFDLIGRDDAAGEDPPMGMILAVVVTVCFIASLLPFLFPGAVIGLLGKVLDDLLGDPVWAFLPFARGTLVTSGPDGPILTLTGVLAIYVPLLLLVLRFGRR